MQRLENQLENGYLPNTIRQKKLGESVLITSDCGTWITLTPQEFEQLKQGGIARQSPLYRRLEQELIIITKQNLDSIIARYKSKHAFLERGATLHMIVLTRRCNMACTYCHASARTLHVPGLDMDLSTARKTVDFIFQSPSKFITIEFQGGEPTVNWDVLKFIVNYSRKLNAGQQRDLRLALVTNLDGMTDEKLDFLIEKKVGICTSLDGPAHVHDHHRKTLDRQSNHTRLTRWVKRIQERGYPINALPTITANALKYPKEIVREYFNKGLPMIHLRSIINEGRAKKLLWGMTEGKGYTPEEFFEFWKQGLEEVIAINKEGHLFKERLAYVMLCKLLRPWDPNLIEMRNPAGIITGALAYNYNGDVYTDDDGRNSEKDIFKLGTVNQTYKDLVTSEKSRSLILAGINDNYICSTCAWKPFCGIHPVTVHSEQDTLVPHVPSLSTCKLYIRQFEYVLRRYLEDEQVQKIFLRWMDD